jgi:hypothetical protein
MTKTPRTQPDMDPRLVDDCKQIGRNILSIVDGSRGVDPEWLCCAVASSLGAMGWIRKRRAAVEADEIDTQAVLDRNPVVYARGEIVEREPEGQGTAA